MGLTSAQRVHALMDFRFTVRQPPFLELVLRHAGVCVPRQYARFAGVAHGGARCTAFFATLVRRWYATAGACLHNRGCVYHAHSKGLYDAIGEPNCRRRRAVPPRLAHEWRGFDPRCARPVTYAYRSDLGPCAAFDAGLQLGALRRSS